MDVENTMRFLLEMQVKHETWLQQHEEAIRKHDEAFARIDSGLAQLVDVSLSLTHNMEEHRKTQAEVFKELRDAQSAMGYKLDALERYGGQNNPQKRPRPKPFLTTTHSQCELQRRRDPLRSVRPLR